MMTPFNLYLLQICITFMMIGVIWQVQLVMYPLFVDMRGFDRNGEAVRKLHRHYTPRISYVVIPLMLTELFLSLYTLYRLPSFTSLSLFSLVVLCWLSTFLFSVPLHNSMEKIDNLKAAKNLVLTNWIRTFLWTLRGVGLLTLIIV